MGVVERLLKPEYVYRPAQLFRRVVRSFQREVSFEELRLPWGMPIYVRTDHHVGQAILHLGLYDLTVSEALWRLIDAGEFAVDVGANIGYMTGIMASRVGAAGRVVAFEPQPGVYEKLVRNVDRWKATTGTRIETYPLALSDHEGHEILSTPDSSERNSGLASLSKNWERPTQYDVAVNRLDMILSETIEMLKIDVEGHESNVLSGAGELLQAQRIRDIIFEEHGSYPTPAISLLESFGYSIFNLGVRMCGLRISSVTGMSTHRVWEPRSCLATVDPRRALKRLRENGWYTLG